jgi:hypothetical protein
LLGMEGMTISFGFSGSCKLCNEGKRTDCLVSLNRQGRESDPVHWERDSQKSLQNNRKIYKTLSWSTLTAWFCCLQNQWRLRL